MRTLFFIFIVFASSIAAQTPQVKILALKSELRSAENEFKVALTESNGKSIEAKNNLEFCRLYKQNSNGNLLADLEFSRTDKQGE